MRGQTLLRSLPHAPGFGFIQERELLRWKTKHLVLNWVKQQLLMSAGLRHKAYRRNRAIKSTRMQGNGGGSGQLSAFFPCTKSRLEGGLVIT